MSYTQEQVAAITDTLRQSLGEDLTWKFEERTQSMLSEFAQNKADRVMSQLQLVLTDQWSASSFKRLPKALKTQLGQLATLSKQQKLLATPAVNDRPTMVALWWPWGHGGTYSLRILLLPQSYETNPSDEGFVSRLKRLLALS